MAIFRFLGLLKKKNRKKKLDYMQYFSLHKY